jgi:squalene-associated FAD-dependent desaturase
MSVPHSRVAVIGGGLAGLAAAAALSRRGLDVELLEAQGHLGGRAGSFRDPHSGRWIDLCQHVAMGCCTNLADFCRRTGIADCFTRHRRLHFFGPDGRRCEFAASRLLPAPLHLVPGLLRLRFLSLGERLGILRTMGRLARLPAAAPADEVTVGQWLRQQGQSDRTVDQFWSVVLASALSETPDRASLDAARKVFVDGFLASRGAHEVLVPRVPLAEIYDRRLRAWMDVQGVAVRLGARVRQIDGDARGVREVVLADGSRRPCDACVVAVPWRRIRGLLAPAILVAIPSLENVEQIEPAAITAVHLWFDRAITRLPHAVLVGRLSQWLFNHGQAEDSRPGRTSRLPRSVPSPPAPLPQAGEGSSGHYYQVVISAAHALAGRNREEIAGQVVAELKAVFPAAQDARVLQRRVVTNPAAVFSVRPGVEALRPAQATAVPNLALAGDWTATGWPATMESAVRSGYLAAEAILCALGRGERLLVPDLPRARLTRWLCRDDREPLTRSDGTLREARPGLG